MIIIIEMKDISLTAYGWLALCVSMVKEEFGLQYHLCISLKIYYNDLTN